MTIQTTNSKIVGMSEINYKYNEKELLEEFSSYVDKTYDLHYSKDKFHN